MLPSLAHKYMVGILKWQVHTQPHTTHPTRVKTPLRLNSQTTNLTRNASLRKKKKELVTHTRTHTHEHTNCRITLSHYRIKRRKNLPTFPPKRTAVVIPLICYGTNGSPGFIPPRCVIGRKGTNGE